MTNKLTEKKKTIIAISLIAISVVFIVLGVYRGEVETVLRKAINICMECIGIG